MHEISTIVCIGAGNVATHLTKSLKEKGYKILQVISRTESRASNLGKSISADYSTDLADLFPHADLYILAVNDDSIAEVAEKLPANLPLVVHTSGSTPLGILKGRFPRCGVFYPLQTFSKEKEISFENIPLLIEASDGTSLEILKNLAGSLSKTVRELDSEKREMLHISAVFACNFTNHMFAVAENLLKTENLDFNLLKPLIRETLEKAMSHSPSKIQTGPARRKDTRIIGNHISLLNKSPEYQNLYTFVSHSIIDFYNKEPNE